MLLRKTHVWFFLTFLVISCSQWDLDRIGFTRVITVGAIEVGSNSAFLIGDIEDIGEERIVESGFVLSATQNQDASLRIGQTDIIQAISPGMDTISEDRAFAARATGLKGSTVYFFRAYVLFVGEAQPAYGNIDQLTTNELSIFLKSVKRNSDDCHGTVLIEVELMGDAPGGGAEIVLVWDEGIYTGTASGLQGEVIHENAPGQTAGGFIFTLPIQCDHEYTIVASVTSTNSTTQYTEIRTFTTKEGGLWLPKSNFPGISREFPISFSIGKDFYLGLGKVFGPAFGDANHYLDLWKYMAIPDQWTHLGDFEDGVSNGIGAELLGKAYFGTGRWSYENCFEYTGQTCGASDGATRNCEYECTCFSGDVFEFDPDTDQWNILEFDIEDKNRISRQGASAIGIRNKIYFGLGNVESKCDGIYTPRISDFRAYTDFWEYSPENNIWTEMQPFPGEGRVNAMAYCMGNKGYFGLGMSFEISGRDQAFEIFEKSSNDFYEFDPSKSFGSQWRLLESFPGEPEFSKGFALAEIGYVLTIAKYDFNSSVEVWKFDQSDGLRGHWSKVSDNIAPGFMGIPQAAISLGNVAMVYFIGTDQNFWMYVPEVE